MEQDAARRMVRAYGGAWRRIDIALGRLQRKIVDARQAGETVDPVWLLQQDRYRSLLAQVEEEAARFGHMAAGEVRRSMVKAAQDGIDYAGQAAAAAIVRGSRPQIDTSWSRLPKGTIGDMVGALSEGSPLHDLFAQYGVDARQAAEAALIEGVVLGENPRKVARRLRQAMAGQLSRARTVARTEMMRAWRESTRRNYQANSNIVAGWVWHSATDSRSCPACWAMHGTEFPLHERLDGHPNCRCAMIPKTRTFADLGIKGVADTGATVPPGEELFDRLPDDQKRKVLGPAAYEAYTDDALRLADLVEQRTDSRWGSMRTTKSLRRTIGDDKANEYRDRAIETRRRTPTSKNVTVSDAVDIQLDGPARTAVTHAVGAIDSVHKVPGLGRLPVRSDPDLPADVAGGFQSLADRLTGRHTPLQIGLNPSFSRHTEHTFVHETGHWLDLTAIGPEGYEASELAQLGDGPLVAWWRTVRRTPQVEKLEQAKTTAQLRGMREVARVLDYLTSPQELWARSYAQWVTVRSGDTLLLDQLNRLDQASVTPHRWPDGEFGPVADAIDELASTLGWI